MSDLKEYKCPACGGSIEFDSHLQKMKCPYCGKEMDKGFFYSSKWDYTWTPEGKKPHYWRNFPKEYEVVLKKGWANTLQITVFRCANCKVMIINEDDC